jgi:cytochrome bd-type quinol oxidase subunit 2
MKKIIPLSILSILFVFSAVQAAGLSNAFNKDMLGAASGNQYNSETDLNKIIGTSIQAILALLGIIFIVLIVYGGITWMTAEGEESKIEKAKKTIQNSIIGLIIVVSAYAISYFVINALSANTLK